MVSDMQDNVSTNLWDELDDVQIMAKKEKVYNTNTQYIYIELRKKLEKLSEFIPISYPDRAKIVQNLWQDFNKLGPKQKECLRKFESEILKRGINSKTISNAQIEVKLQKFTGYDSLIDIFSFQTEFEELIYGKVEKRLQPRLLKNNYLGDSALTLVKNGDCIDEIWKKLKKAFGNSDELLKNK